MSKKENKVDQATATQFFEDFADAMGLDIDESSITDDEELQALKKLKAVVIKAISRGALTFNEDTEAVYTPCRKASGHQSPITFYERRGVDLMAMDGKGKGKDITKVYAVMASMTKLETKDISGLAGQDLTVCMAIFQLLMD